jgi:hypothetical protein
MLTYGDSKKSYDTGMRGTSCLKWLVLSVLHVISRTFTWKRDNNITTSCVYGPVNARNPHLLSFTKKIPPP